MDCTGLGAGVQEQEVARAVGVLGLADREARLAEHGRLLVAEDAGDRDARRATPFAFAVLHARRLDLGQHRPGHAHRVEDLVVPVERLQVHQHRARRVGRVGDVNAAVRPAGQVPHDPRVHVPEDDVPALGALADAGDVVDDPLDLRAGEVGRERQADLLAGTGPGRRRGRARRRCDRCACPATRSRCAPACPVLRFQTTVVSRWLVMPTAARSDGGQAALLEGALHHLLRALPDLRRRVLDPAGLREDLLVLLLIDRDRPCPRGRTPCSGCWSSPDRSRQRTSTWMRLLDRIERSGRGCHPEGRRSAGPTTGTQE